MSTSQMLTIRNNLDVILMRMQVRDLARAIGMTLSDQACIALAVSSLANALGFEGAFDGQVTMDCLRNGARVGLRVIYVKANGMPPEMVAKTLDNTQWMVDELNIERLPPDVLKITLVKWMAEG